MEEAEELSRVPPVTLNEPAKPIVEGITPPPAVEVVSRPEPEITKPIFTSGDEPQKLDAEAIQIANVSSPINVAEESPASPVGDIQRTIGDGGGLINDQNMVGDKSWEEKAWKEVVRLREEMFCARIGIVR